MDNTRLRYIETVAQYGSISRAADALYITPSALSKFIKKIEEDNGIHLFDRVGKKFVLTYAGERYIYWLSNISALYNQMNEEMNDISNSYTGRLKVGVQIDGSNIIIDRVLPRFYQTYPNTLIELYEHTSNNLREMLEDNLLDFAIVPDRDLSTSLKTCFLSKNHRVLVVPKNHKIIETARSKSRCEYPWIDLHKIGDYPFVAPFPQQDAYRVYSEILADNIKLNIVAHMQNLASQLRCVKEGIGFAISSDKIVKSTGYLDSLTLLSIGSRPVLGNQVVAYNKSHYMTRTADYFIELVKDAYQENDGYA